MLMLTMILCSAAPALNELEEVLTAASGEDMLAIQPVILSPIALSRWVYPRAAETRR